jgi:hypothetical protein
MSKGTDPGGLIRSDIGPFCCAAGLLRSGLSPPLGGPAGSSFGAA